MRISSCPTLNELGDVMNNAAKAMTLVIQKNSKFGQSFIKKRNEKRNETRYDIWSYEFNLGVYKWWRRTRRII